MDIQYPTNMGLIESLGQGIRNPSAETQHENTGRMHKIAQENLRKSGITEIAREITGLLPGEFYIEELSWDESANTGSDPDTQTQHPGSPFSAGLLISWDEKIEWKNCKGTAHYKGILVEAKVSGEIEVRGGNSLSKTSLKTDSAYKKKYDAFKKALRHPYSHDRPCAGANEYGGGWLIT